MPRFISGQRIARSLVTPTGTAAVSRELDFQLAADQGISIDAVVGGGHLHDDSPATSDTVPSVVQAVSSLHLETGSLETPPIIAGADEDDIDTEIFWMQTFQNQFQVPSTAGGGGGWATVTPDGLVMFKEPILTARNITFRGQTFFSDQDFEAWVLIYYHFVIFTTSELGLFLARRQ